jgi:hypothetical protein
VWASGVGTGVAVGSGFAVSITFGVTAGVGLGDGEALAEGEAEAGAALTNASVDGLGVAESEPHAPATTATTNSARKPRLRITIRSLHPPCAFPAMGEERRGARWAAGRRSMGLVGTWPGAVTAGRG